MCVKFSILSDYFFFLFQEVIFPLLMLWKISTGLVTMLVLQQAVCEDENIFNRIRRQLPRYHYGNSLSRKPYSENFTNLFLPDHSNQGFFFQLDVPFWERNIFRADFENGEWRFFQLWKQLDAIHPFRIVRAEFGRNSWVKGKKKKIK